MSHLSVARNPQFAKLWASQILSQLAQQLLNFSLIIRVFNLAQGTHFANFAVSILILSFGIPAVLFATLAGVYVDHLDKKRVLVISNFLRLGLILAFFLTQHDLIGIYLLTFAIASITPFYWPAEASAIPLIVGEDRLLSANALFIFTFYGSFMLGYSLAAPIIKLFGINAPLVVSAAMMAAAGLVTLKLPALPAGIKRVARGQELIERVFGEVNQNWRAILANPKLLFPILELTLVQAIIGLFSVLAPAVSQSVLHRALADATTILVIPIGLGMIIGVVWVGRFATKYNKINLMNIGMGLAGVMLSILGAIKYGLPGLAFAVAGVVAILGFLNAIISVAAQTMLQENTDDATRGRVFGALNMLINLAATLPILLAGVLADLMGVSAVILGSGLMVIGFTLAQLILAERRSVSEPS